VFPRGYPPRRGSRTPPTASPRDIVGLIWRSGINQRANILPGPGNAAGARRRSFYRRRKTIRIYIRAREERVCVSGLCWCCARATPESERERERERERPFVGPFLPGPASSAAASALLRTMPAAASHGAALERAYGMAYWSEGRAGAAITALLPAGFCGCTSPRPASRSYLPLSLSLFLSLLDATLLAQTAPSLSIRSRCIACERRKCAVNAFGQCGLRKLTIECEIVVRVSYDLARHATPVHSAPGTSFPPPPHSLPLPQGR